MKKLVYFADLIEAKFSSGRTADLTPELLNSILAVLKQAGEQENDPQYRATLKVLESKCLAAMVHYRSPAERMNFFSELRAIAALLRKLEGL